MKMVYSILCLVFDLMVEPYIDGGLWWYDGVIIRF